MLWKYWSSCEKHDAAASVSVARVMWTYKGDVNSALGGNSKEPSSSTVSAETSFDEDSNNETLNVYNVLPAIIDKKIEINYIKRTRPYPEHYLPKYYLQP